MHWHLCEKVKLHNTDKWCKHKPDGVSENNNCKIWDVIIQCDKKIQASQPDIIVVDKCKKEGRIVDIAMPGVMPGCVRMK